LGIEIEEKKKVQGRERNRKGVEVERKRKAN